MRTVLVLPQNDLIWEFMKGLHGFISNWTFLNFLNIYGKNPCKKKKGWQKFFRRTRKILNTLKNFPEKNKNFKAIWAALSHSKPKIFSDIFFKTFVPPTNLVLLRPCIVTDDSLSTEKLITKQKRGIFQYLLQCS